MTPPLPPLSAFADPVALTIVVGGTALAALLRTPLRDAARGVRAIGGLAAAPFSADALLTQIDALARITARHGVVQLDRSVIRDADVALAVDGVVDGIAPAVLAARLEHARLARFERHRAAADLWVGIAELAPAMGLIGTLVGLVRMFLAMSDPAAIGAAMATALLTTLYGAVLANAVAIPIAGRLRARARQEYLERARLAEPLLALAEREQPRRPRLERSA